MLKSPATALGLLPSKSPILRTGKNRIAGLYKNTTGLKNIRLWEKLLYFKNQRYLIEIYHPVGKITREAKNQGWYDLLMRQYEGK